MPDLPLNRTIASTPAEHLADHLALHQAFNGLALGPFVLAHDTANIDTGVTLFTPAVGDRIMGLFVEFTQVWDVVGETIGLGIAGTTDADLGMVFPVATMLPSHPTWVRGEGLGLMYGASAIRLLTTAPIVARTVTGGNTTGGLNLWVQTIPATAF